MMSWRVSIVMVLVVLLFGAFAWLYVKTFVRKHPPGVILFIIDGLDLQLLEQARQQAHPVRALPDDPALETPRLDLVKKSSALNLETFWNVAYLHLASSSEQVPDEAAQVTALACGVSVPNGCIAENGNGAPLPSLMDAARKAQRATGLITTDSLIDPVPAAFYTHRYNAINADRLEADILESKIGLLLGGGLDYYDSMTSDLEKKAQQNGTIVLRNVEDVRHAPTWYSPRMLGLFGAFDFTGLPQKNTVQPSLAEMTTMALSSLNHSLNSYFLVVHEKRIALAGRQNLTPLALAEVGPVDEAIQAAVDYAGPDALVLVTDNYSLGALSSHGSEPFWLSGPGGPPQTTEDKLWWQKTYGKLPPDSIFRPQPACFFQRQATPTNEPAWLISRGKGSDQFRGFMNKTNLYSLIVAHF